VKSVYNFFYRTGLAPYDTRTPTRQLVDVVESGRLQPCRCLELACGPGRDALYLAEKGFEVTAVDFAEAGIELAKERARKRGVDVDFRVEDVTSLASIEGEFDLVLDCGSLSDLGYERRSQAYDALDRFLGPSTRFFIWCFEWPPVFYERWFFPNGGMSFSRAEVRERFADRFEIDKLDGRVGGPFRGFGCYLLTPRGRAPA
jgi:SAM-dependent methyltransferase